jgi:hypothetical protein
LDLIGNSEILTFSKSGTVEYLRGGDEFEAVRILKT